VQNATEKMSRIRNKEIAKKFREIPCLLCGKTRGTVGHHLLTVGAHPELVNDERNIVGVCMKHHLEFHALELHRMVIKYRLEKFMLLRDFIFIEYSNRWVLK